MKAKRRRRRVAIILGTLLVSSLIAVEVGAWVLCRVFSERVTWFDAEAFTVERELVEDRLVRYFDADLGWRPHYDSFYGERPRERAYDRAWIATYGDSFTHGDEVEANETWQTFLARQGEADVFNFGVGGHGTDQALIRFRRDHPRCQAPVAILGFTTENINRILSRFRKFYFPKTGIPQTKPRFLLGSDGELELLPNPLASLDDLPKLMDPAFVSSLGVHDHWFNPRGLPHRRFPYSQVLFNRGFWQELGVVPGKPPPDDTAARPWLSTWQAPEHRALIDAIMRSFAREAETHGVVPIVLLIPRAEELRERYASGEATEVVRLATELLGRLPCRTFDGLEALAQRVTSTSMARGCHTNHLTPMGTQLLARELYAYLEREGLGPERALARPAPLGAAEAEGGSK